MTTGNVTWSNDPSVINGNDDNAKVNADDKAEGDVCPSDEQSDDESLNDAEDSDYEPDSGSETESDIDSDDDVVGGDDAESVNVNDDAGDTDMVDGEDAESVAGYIDADDSDKADDVEDDAGNVNVDQSPDHVLSRFMISEHVGRVGTGQDADACRKQD